jgi:hypothetical protein
VAAVGSVASIVLDLKKYKPFMVENWNQCNIYSLLVDVKISCRNWIMWFLYHYLLKDSSANSILSFSKNL